MKRLICVFVIGLVFLPACSQEPEKLEGWEDVCWITSDLMPPVCAVWYKPGPLGWLPYKCFATGQELREIVRLLRDEADTEVPHSWFEGSQKLSFIFYKGRSGTFDVSEFYFELSGDVFYWPCGKSQKLGKIFREKEPWGEFYQNPYDPNLIKRIKESQEFLRKQAERLKAEKEAEVQKRTEEVNQPE
ncbi:MAG: hypothetical protein JSW00_05525 [Thermoplasmata archaeon]|nr:MAG: hypothetical protein JSW00_05525 [Thermoplasmata archaeon]